MANLVKELGELDFSAYIGGPMQAAIQAQHTASLSEALFIKDTGFNKKTGKIEYVDFSYTKTVPVETTATNGVTTTTIEKQEYKLSVPLLSLITIPAIRIDEMTIDFNVKLTSCETVNVDSEFNTSAQTGFNFGRLINFKASASYRRKTSSTTETNRSYDLAVHVRVVNDEIPAGLDRVLRMLENQVKDEKKE
jgi:hypothetical protein